jgi:hypothetical protein
MFKLGQLACKKRFFKHWMASGFTFFWASVAGDNMIFRVSSNEAK